MRIRKCETSKKYKTILFFSHSSAIDKIRYPPFWLICNALLVIYRKYLDMPALLLCNFGVISGNFTFNAPRIPQHAYGRYLVLSFSWNKTGVKISENIHCGQVHLNFYLSLCQISQITLGIQGNITLNCIFLLARRTLEEKICFSWLKFYLSRASGHVISLPLQDTIFLRHIDSWPVHLHLRLQCLCLL